MKTQIYTSKAAAPVGPYSQAIKAGNQIYISDQIGLTPEGNYPGNDVQSQARQVLENIKMILEEAGGKLSDVVKVNIFLTDMGDFATVNEIYAEYFSESEPARTAVEVAAMPKGALLGMDAVAVVE